MPTSYNVTPDGVKSATIGYSNKNESGREWDINADVQISDGKVSNYGNGEIRRTRIDEETGNIPTANFNSSVGGSYFSITFSNATPEQRVEMLNAIETFMQSVAENVKNYELPASL